ncbi:hypothetical protein FOQG_16557 [Fusarium oxysporum f. sp. raphani 54005]|uniref:SET domain-containing protein n=3 Tax=Fusarium oxysporum TaxID=5507 RepID=X0B9I5_FUSOX|nr:hypothetical protein FOVG_13422 [Fusarium oxysporum f. sp. pisi HDV247]EXK78795.1 hypothetical protein FOQG_16557 [Fusarium oxysporum f. sp. raphani 54005]EXL70585.1 hypothetical protein FOPG_13581 [Fusarium oxysporum f. sp. conglutinans race 2 54008]
MMNPKLMVSLKREMRLNMTRILVVISTLAHIYGNWTQKMNHSCNFNVQFVSMRVSRKWRVMIQAVRNIAPGEPVTVDYGAEYWEGTAFSCMCGSARCIYGNKKEDI